MEPVTYTPKTDDEIKALAQETVRGMIFWATMAPEDMVGSVFMVLGLCDKEHVKPLIEHNAVPYEYMEKAGPRSVNGYPCFFSMHWVSGDDYNKIAAKVKAINEAIEKA